MNGNQNDLKIKWERWKETNHLHMCNVCVEKISCLWCFRSVGWPAAIRADHFAGACKCDERLVVHDVAVNFLSFRLYAWLFLPFDRCEQIRIGRVLVCVRCSSKDWTGISTCERRRKFAIRKLFGLRAISNVLGIFGARTYIVCVHSNCHRHVCNSGSLHVIRTNERSVQVTKVGRFILRLMSFVCVSIWKRVRCVHDDLPLHVCVSRCFDAISRFSVRIETLVQRSGDERVPAIDGGQTASKLHFTTVPPSAICSPLW